MRKNIKLVMVERERVSNLSLARKSTIGDSIGYPLSDPYFVSTDDIMKDDHIYIPRSGRILKCEGLRNGKVIIKTSIGEREVEVSNCMRLEATWDSIRWIKTKSRKSIFSTIADSFCLKKMEASDLRRILDNGGDCVIDQSIGERNKAVHLIFDI